MTTNVTMGLFILTDGRQTITQLYFYKYVLKTTVNMHKSQAGYLNSRPNYCSKNTHVYIKISNYEFIYITAKEFTVDIPSMLL